MKHYWNVIAIVLLALASVVPALAQTQVQLPPLTGEYAVGRVTFDFADTTRKDPFVTGSTHPICSPPNPSFFAADA